MPRILLLDPRHMPLLLCMCITGAAPVCLRRRCCGAIVHGGIGHVLSCLANGCPLLVTP